MLLSKLYTNKPGVFSPVQFNTGLSVVLAEIRLPENRRRDTHNLGKTTLGQLIDFCLLKGKSQSYFLFRHAGLFGDFSFLLELRLGEGRYLTVLRSVAQGSRISFKSHPSPNQDYAGLPPDQWDHFAVPFERAKKLLDGILDFRALRPWDFRKEVGYLVRSQADYGDVFQLSKHKGRHSDWKPVLAQILGFNSRPVEALYAKRDELEAVQRRIRTMEVDSPLGDLDVSTIEGLLLFKTQDVERRLRDLDAFDFGDEDLHANEELVDDLDERIASLNEERYALSQVQRKLQSSMEEQRLLFDTDEATQLFADAGVVFGGQIKRDFDQLISFNRAITEERQQALQSELAEVAARLLAVDDELAQAGDRRSQLLSFLSDTSAFAKYKTLSRELVELRADVASLTRQRDALERLQEQRSHYRRLSEEIGALQTEIEAGVAVASRDANSRFGQIREYFKEIVESVIDARAILAVSPNGEGNLEFKAEILDETGSATSRDRGNSYRKLLCVAFDLAVLRSYLGENFPRFVYHDGVFESLDNRKKVNLLGVLREYAALGIQPVVTAIDSDLPEPEQGMSSFLLSEDVILTLHDEGQDGRLFKMATW